MLTRQNIFLIGPMGSGKTAVGRALARRLGWDFHDSDAEVEARTGVDVPYVFEKEGESGFRQREHEALERLTRLEPVVLATGGGAILHPDNRRVLAERGRVVYLETPVAQQLARTRRSRNRPLLQHNDPAQRLQQLMQIREPLYRDIADITVSTDGRRVTAVVGEILRLLQGR
jgi:shikimate kinase